MTAKLLHMELSKAVASLALLLGVLLATGYARGTDIGTPDGGKGTVQERLVAREAVRRAALAEHHRRKEDFARLCTKPLMSAVELEACRVAYRRL
jgi:hypothetical protein